MLNVLQQPYIVPFPAKNGDFSRKSQISPRPVYVTLPPIAKSLHISVTEFAFGARVADAGGSSAASLPTNYYIM